MQVAQTTPAEEQVPNGDAVVFPPEQEDDEDEMEQVTPLVLFPVEREDAGDDEQDDETEQPPPQQDSPQLSKEEERVLNLTEPLTPLVTSVQQSRALLRSFEAQLPDLRAQLAAGNGWFDIFYVNKKSLKAEVRTFLQALRREQKRKIAVPKEIEQAVHPEVARFFRRGGELPPIPRELEPYIFDFTEYGPYAKYRWRENKRTYTVSLGLDTDYPDLPF